MPVLGKVRFVKGRNLFCAHYLTKNAQHIFTKTLEMLRAHVEA